MEQILLAYSLLKETTAAIMMLYKNTKVKVRSLDGDPGFFDIVTGVLQRDTLTPYLFIICLLSVLRTLIDLMKKWLYFGKGKKQKTPCMNNYRCGLY